MSSVYRDRRLDQLVFSEEKSRGIRLHIRQNSRMAPHLDGCRACQRAIRNLQKDTAWCSADLFPDLSREQRAYHLVQLRKAGVFKGTISFWSTKMLKAYRAWRDGATALQIERRYGYSNWHSCLDKLAKPCPGVGRHEARDLRPNWQKDLEGHDIKRLTKFRLYGLAITEKTVDGSLFNRRYTPVARDLPWRMPGSRCPRCEALSL